MPDSTKKKIKSDSPATAAADPLNPDYYKHGNVEVIQLCRHLPFNRGCIVKYAARAGLKNKDEEVQDLEKIIWYARDEIQRLTGEGNHAK